MSSTSYGKSTVRLPSPSSLCEQRLTRKARISDTSKEIPKFQRRGAIITLGMFAQPKPEVVAEHVETLLKIGLGSLGRVRPFLVRIRRWLILIQLV